MRRQDEKEYSFSGSALQTFKELLFAAAAPPFPFSPTPPYPQITNAVREAGRFSRASQHFSTWPKLVNKEDPKLIHPGDSGCVEECIRLRLKEFGCGFRPSIVLMFVSISECLQAFLSPAAPTTLCL